MRLATLLLASLFLITGCEWFQDAPQSGWVKYNDPEAGFALTYPAAWKKSATNMPRASLLVRGLQDDKGLSCSMYHERFDNLTDIDTETALASVNPELIKAALSGNFKDVSLTEQPRATLSGLPANRYAVTYQLAKIAGRSEPYMGEVLVAVENGGVYNFFCGAPVAKFATESPRFDRVRRSIMIIPSSKYKAPY